MSVQVTPEAPPSPHLAPLLTTAQPLSKTSSITETQRSVAAKTAGGVNMSSKSAKIGAAVLGIGPAIGVFATALSESPWTALAALGSIVALALVAAWLLSRRPYFEISDSIQGGVRRRLWRAGVGQLPRGAVHAPPSTSRRVSPPSASAQRRSALSDEDADPPSARG